MQPGLPGHTRSGLSKPSSRASGAGLSSPPQAASVARRTQRILIMRGSYRDEAAPVNDLGRSDADRAAHPGAAEPAVTVGALAEVLLVIILSIIEFGRAANFRRDVAISR